MFVQKIHYFPILQYKEFLSIYGDIFYLRPGSDAAPLVPNLTDELSTAKERRLNQFGTAVLVWCGKSVEFDRVCRTFVELNLGSTHGTPSESDVALVSLQSRTYSVRFGT